MDLRALARREDRPATSLRAGGLLPLAARLLLAVLFFTSSLAKVGSWQGNVDYVAAKLPLAPVLLAFALAAEVVTWIGLVTGYRARLAATIGFLYMIPVTLVFHGFMSTQFQKNLGMMGGLLLVAAFGPGRLALGRRPESRRETAEAGR
jgi:putative oxidoreductase